MFYDHLHNQLTECQNELTAEDIALAGDLILALSRAATECLLSCKSLESLTYITLDDVDFCVDVFERGIDICHCATGVVIMHVIHELPRMFSKLYVEPGIADYADYSVQGYATMGYTLDEFYNFVECTEYCNNYWDNN